MLKFAIYRGMDAITHITPPENLLALETPEKRFVLRIFRAALLPVKGMTSLPIKYINSRALMRL